MRDWILDPCYYIHKCLITFLVLDQPVERFPGLSLRDAASNSGKTPNINWSLLDVLLARNKKANKQQLPQKSISNHVPFWELYGYESEISKFQNQNVKTYCSRQCRSNNCHTTTSKPNKRGGEGKKEDKYNILACNLLSRSFWLELVTTYVKYNLASSCTIVNQQVEWICIIQMPNRIN